MGIISKSVAHACSGGARGFFKPNDQEYGKAAGVVKFYRDQEKPGRYVSEFKDPVLPYSDYNTDTYEQGESTGTRTVYE